MTSPLRSALLLAALAALLSLVTAAVYGAHDGWVTLSMLLVVGGAVLGAAHVAVSRRKRLGSLRRQMAVAVTIGAVAVALALAAAVELMFVSAHDAFFGVIVVVLGGGVAVRAAQLFARPAIDEIDRLRATLTALDGLQEPGGDELAGLARAADATIARLAASESARRDLVAAVSHDLRTPITTLRLLAEAVHDEVVDDATRDRYLGQMRVHVNALAGLIDDLFELSRLEAGELTWTMQRVELGELVGETVEAMLVHGDAKGVSVHADVSATLRAAHANPEKLQRVLFNLIQNAIRHTPPDGSVTVLVEEGEGGVEIEVADTGAGIAAGERSRIFEPFFRGGADSARTRSGAGLGLAISRAIVEAHGGQIWLEQAPLGTRVRFSLPAAA